MNLNPEFDSGLEKIPACQVYHDGQLIGTAAVYLPIPINFLLTFDVAAFESLFMPNKERADS